MKEDCTGPMAIAVDNPKKGDGPTTLIELDGDTFHVTFYMTPVELEVLVTWSLHAH